MKKRKKYNYDNTSGYSKFNSSSDIPYIPSDLMCSKGNKYLPLEKVELSEKTFSVILQEQVNVRTKEFNDFKEMFNALYTDDIKTAEKIRNQYSEKKYLQRLYELFQKNTLGNDEENVQNLTMSLITILEWSKNKQVFMFDKDFLMELAETESIMFRKDMLDYLPYETFYLDVKDIGNDSGIEGILVSVFKKTDSYEIGLIFMNKKGHSVYSFNVKNADYEIKNQNLNLIREKFAKELAKELGIDTAINSLKTALNEKTKNEETGFKICYDYWKNMILQILTYLCSEKPDIQESEETKHTYRKPNENFKPKNKFSEVQKWEVGVRFGTSIRKWKIQKENKSQDNSDNHSESNKHQKPHYRRGHWHSYWCNQIVDGKKIKRLVPKWLAPIFVNKDLCDDVDVVIHKS